MANSSFEIAEAPHNRGALRTAFLFVSAVIILVSLVLPAKPRKADATPIFAQAYGLKCTACHLQVPILNAFGRYIQRTGYGALDYRALQHALPVFLFDPGTSYTYQGGQPSHSYRISDPLQTTILYALGALGPKFTYNAEHGVTLNGEPGWLLNTWLGYHGLLGGKGHLFVGKLTALNLDEFGGPSLLSDVTNDPQPLQFVSQGIHNYYYDYNQGRWGAQFNLVQNKYAVEVAYLGGDSNSTSFDNAYNFSRGSNRSVQFKTAYADPSSPWEAGIMGETGTYGWTGSAVPGTLHQDHYAVVGPYFMKDPRPGSPGFRFEYQSSTDDDTGYLPPTAPGTAPKPSGPTHGSWMTGSVYQMILNNKFPRQRNLLSYEFGARPARLPIRTVHGFRRLDAIDDCG